MNKAQELLFIIEGLKDVKASELIKHIDRTGAQSPHPRQIDGYESIKFGKVKLKDIQLSPNPSIEFRASDPKFMDKVKKSFEEPQDSIDQAKGFVKKGGKFPAVILSAGYKGKPPHSIEDGFHRVLAAAIRGDKEIEAYVVH
jgi:hypothetical protein